MLISIKAFSGEVPRIGDYLLNNGQSQYALNSKLWSGELRCHFEDRSVEEILEEPVNSTYYKTLYRYPRPSDTAIWLRWDEEVHIAKGPVFNDLYNRLYFTGLDTPRVFDSTFVDSDTVTIDSTNSYPLAIDQPVIGTIAVTGTAGGGNLEARAYVYTYGREWADGKFDEGQASLPAETSGGDLTIDVETGQTATLTLDAPDVTRTDISHITIYRTVTGSDVTTMQFVTRFDASDALAGSVTDVASIGSNQLTFTDNVATEDLGEGLQTVEWTAPIDELSGLISLNNGVLVGFYDNDVYFSEPYQPHAFPAIYRQTVDYNIIGLGHFGNTVVILTDTYPLMVSVSDPAATIVTPINEIAPCSSNRSIVSTSDSVYYASPHGLIQISSNGIVLASQQLFSKDDWYALNPSSFISAMYEGKLLTFYVTTDSTYGSFIIDLAESNASVTRLAGYIETFYVEPSTDKLYYIYKPVGLNRYVWEWEGLPSLNKTMVWKSKKFRSTSGPTTFSAARVYVDRECESTLSSIQDQINEYAEAWLIPDLNGPLNELTINETTLNGDSFEDIRNTLRVSCDAKFKFYVDGALVFTKTIDTDLPFRLPSGVVGTTFEFEIESNMNIYQVDIATSMNELLG